MGSDKTTANAASVHPVNQSSNAGQMLVGDPSDAQTGHDGATLNRPRDTSRS